MEIQAYTFGRMVIDGRAYTADLILYPDRVDPSWWRREGHRLALEDLQGVLEAQPEVLVVGTGYWGRMKVPAEVQQALEAQGIHVEVAPTREAVTRFQTWQKRGRTRVVGAFHLTC